MRLCISIHGVWVNPLKVRRASHHSTSSPSRQLKKSAGKLRNEFPIAWINTSVFDFRGYLRSGKQFLKTWPYKSELDELLNPLGTTMLNPETSHPVLTVEFEVVRRCPVDRGHDM